MTLLARVLPHLSLDELDVSSNQNVAPETWIHLMDQVPPSLNSLTMDRCALSMDTLLGCVRHLPPTIRIFHARYNRTSSTVVEIPREETTHIMHALMAALQEKPELRLLDLTENHLQMDLPSLVLQENCPLKLWSCL